MKTIVLASLILACNFLFAQDSTSWKEMIVYPVDSSGIWTTDVLGNTYIYSNQVINKFDSTGLLKFSQSIKSLGNISEIQVVNTMKVVTFSEEQQLICYLDNTLTVSEDCLDLQDKNVDFSTAFSVSSRPDKLWIYDQMNSRLRLVSVENQGQEQVIENIRGLLNASDIEALREHNGQLYVFVKGKGIYIFDLYGTLIKSLPYADVMAMAANEQFLYLLYNNKLVIRHLADNRELSVPLPLPDITGIHIDSHFIYFRTSTAIHKYELLFSK